jgi:putative phage-type endonuclease
MIEKSKIIHHEVEQRSDEWVSLRIGKLTGSTFADVMPADKARVKWTQAQEKALMNVAAEILTGKSSDRFFVNEAMQWGIDTEDEAMEAVSLELLCPAKKCGIFQRGEYIAASPDGILGDNDKTLELKCPASATHLKYLLDPDSLWKEYKWQVLGEMYCTGLDSGIIASYDPRFLDESKRLLIYEPADYMDDLKRLEDRMGEVEEKIKELIE